MNGIKFTKKEKAVMDLLLKNQGETVSAREIEREALGHDDPTWTNKVAVHIKHIRRKLADAKPDAIIQTFRGEGYRLWIGDAAITPAS